MNPLDPGHHAEELKAALAAVQAAAALTEAVRASTRPDTLEKGDRSPVTIADFGSQAVVCRTLEVALPDDPVIAEESADALRRDGHQAVLERVTHFVRGVVADATAESVLHWIDRGALQEARPRFWTLDPIDGTKGFLRGDQYAVALALIEGNRPVVAALACPALPGADGAGVVQWAVSGAGTWEAPLGDLSRARRISVTEARTPREARLAESVESGHSSHTDSARVQATLGISRPPVRMDSQAKYALVARGQADMYMRLPVRKAYTERIWDHAAGSLVVSESGGRVTDVFGNALDFGYGAFLKTNTGVVATNGHLHDPVLAALEREGIGLKPVP
ncbi:MAG: 3'(2'),5'-bisphosphate nucleotidase [Rhodothermales bacterium]|nr:3'(2'),5'-bisphosphate nucleotidase [Rhodothermales bacterium]MBO6781365.1 3'(2'),5'-bisphosphate nucleotidase [Rhodothermales bacterium]